MTVKDFFQKTIVQVAIGAAILVSIGLAANYAYTEYDDRQFKAYMQEQNKWIEIYGLYWSAKTVFGLVEEPCPLETGYRSGDEPLAKFVYQPTEKSRKYTAMALEKYNNDPETELKITEEELEDFLQNHMDEILDESVDVTDEELEEYVQNNLDKILEENPGATNEEFKEYMQNDLDVILNERQDVANRIRAFIEWGRQNDDLVWCEGNSQGKEPGTSLGDTAPSHFTYIVEFCDSPEGKLDYQFAYEYEQSSKEASQ